MEKMTEHSVSLVNRAEMSLTGICEVSEFSDTRVILKTSMGNLSIKGKKLVINQLNTDTGTLDVNGEIQNIAYTTSASDGFLAGLFK